MTSELFRDVPDVLTELRLAGVKTYIYSSGSREAQKLFFGHCQVDDDNGQGSIVLAKNSPLTHHGHPASSIPVPCPPSPSLFLPLFPSRSPSCPPPPAQVGDLRPPPHSSPPAPPPAPPHAQVGDLRPYLCGFFDTTSGPKLEARSYRDIALSLGVDSPSELLFATDVLGEAVAARAAGWQAVLVSRPGNKALAAGHGFREITTLKDLVPGL